jgi:hypothetical protein
VTRTALNGCVRKVRTSFPRHGHEACFASPWKCARPQVLPAGSEPGRFIFVLGDAKQAAALLAAIFVIIIIAFYQEQKTDRALEAPRDPSRARSRGSRRRGTFDRLTPAICMMPKEFLVVLTVFLALVAWRMSWQNMLMRRPPSIPSGRGPSFAWKRQAR